MIRRSAMSLEPGGRSDKYGNEYENKFLAKLFIRLVDGELKSITVEPLGEDSDSVEYIAVDKNNLVLHYQCKESNNTSKSWTLTSLENHSVFSRSKNIIEKNPLNRYVFISPLSYGELPELCKRALTNSSTKDFVSNQLNNKNIRKAFCDCAKYFQLDKEDEVQCSLLVKILSKCAFETVVFDTEGTKDLEGLIGSHFTGNPQGARTFLEHYVNSNGRYGMPITADEIILEMEKSNFFFRKNYFSDNNAARILEMNNSFLETFPPINGKTIHRSETDKVIEELSKGNSVILQGKAGVGKSGCVYEIANYLCKSNILFLALKLDKSVPTTSADHFGEELGLRQSPVCCLHNISAGKPCVLILDQLDALRWTSHHSGAALDVCKQLISQTKTLNKNDNGHISLLFITRTFDLENDEGLKILFSTKQEDDFSWSKIEISPFTKEDVVAIIGDDYYKLSHKLQEILLTPSSLYIWASLKDRSDSCDISTPFALMEKWWKQILDNCNQIGVDIDRTTRLKDSIVNSIESSASTWQPKQIYADNDKELQALISNGLLIEKKNHISFAHQSFLDNFAVSGMLKKIYSGVNIVDVIGSFDEQTPYIRYRLLRVLQILIENKEFFVDICNAILNSDSVRHYFKCAVFEVLSQCEEPNALMLDIVYKYYSNADWHDYIYNTVFWGHPQYILSLDNRNGFCWSDDNGLKLLSSINTKAQNFVLEKTKPFLFSSKELDLKLYQTLCWDCINDSQEMFNIRLKLLDMYIDELYDFWGYSQLIKSNSKRLIPILKLVIKHSNNKKRTLHFDYEDNFLKYSKDNYRDIIDELLPEICEKTMHFNPRWPNYEYNEPYNHWTKDNLNKNSSRTIVEMVTSSLCEFATTDTKSFLQFIEKFDGKNSVVYYEIVANAIYSLNTDYSDFAISWLCSDPNNHLFIYTGDSTDYLSLTKKMLDKFSPHCTKTCFERIENLILHWREPAERMKKIYKYRLEMNRQGGNAPVYYAYWGHLQKELLPCLHKQRISENAKQLIGVLNRNEWIHTPYYYQGWSISPASGVFSPLHNKAERIPDKTWLKIISTPNGKMKEHFCSYKKMGAILKQIIVLFQMICLFKQNTSLYALLSSLYLSPKIATADISRV